jgi:PAS domain S-box-containing protein
LVRDSIVPSSAERSRYTQALAASQHRYQQLFDSTPLPMWVYDRESLAFLEVNEAAVEHYGYSREEFLRMTLLDIRSAEERSKLLEAVGRPAFDPQAPAVWRHLKKGGQPIDVEIRSRKIDFHGRDAQLAIAHDVTQLLDVERSQAALLARVEKTLNSAVDTVARMVEVRDPYTAGHERRVAELSVTFGRALGLPERQLEGLRIGGYLHDVGKIAVPAELLAKPGRLTPHEFAVIKMHAEQGFVILEPLDFPWPVAEMARQHHERVDGSGYPRGLVGDAILLEARIMAVADVVESMASDRPYRSGLGIDAALAEIEKNRGRLYDPDVADACLSAFRSQGLTLPA